MLLKKKKEIVRRLISNTWYQSLLSSLYLMAFINSLVNSQISNLLQDNYESWAIQMRALFGSQDLSELIAVKFTEPIPKEEATYNAHQKRILKEQSKKDSKTSFLLYQGLDEPTFERVTKATTNTEAWKILATISKRVKWFM